MAKILVTCAGSGIGQSAIDSLLLSRKHLIIGCDNNRNVYANHFCNTFFVAPEIYSDYYLDFIINLCIDEDIDLVIPGHDHELFLFSNNISQFNEKGIEVIVSRPDLIEISRDKYKWYKYFNEKGCPIVPTYKINEFKVNPDINILPAIVKPIGGSSSQGIIIANKLSDLDNVSDNDIIQPYLFPTKDDVNYSTIERNVKNGRFTQMSEISIQLIFSKTSQFSGIFISKNVLKNGIPVHVDPIQPDEFEYLTDIMKFVPVCVENSVRGPVNIQGRITDKGLICFEMNMRFTGITGNRAQLGFNEVDFLVDDFLGLSPSKIGDYAINKYGVRQVACTTILKEPNYRRRNKSICILCGSSNTIIEIKSFVEEGKGNNFTLICKDITLKDFKSVFNNSSNIHIISENSKATESAYGKCDVFISFVGVMGSFNQEEILSNVIFLNQQFNRLIRLKVPSVITLKSSELVVFADIRNCHQKVELFKFFNSFNFELLNILKEHCPSTNIDLIEINSSSNHSIYRKILCE